MDIVEFLERRLKAKGKDEEELSNLVFAIKCLRFEHQVLRRKELGRRVSCKQSWA